MDRLTLRNSSPARYSTRRLATTPYTFLREPTKLSGIELFDQVPAGVGVANRVVTHIAVAIQPARQHGIGAGELAHRRIVVAGAVVIQPSGAIGSLAGE